MIDEKVEFESVLCVDATVKAIRVIIDGKGHWIPNSVVHDDSEVYRKGDEGTLVVKEWFAIKEGLV